MFYNKDIRNSKNFSKRYNWKEIQDFYDEGNSWRDVIAKYGMSSETLRKATRRGELITRTQSEGVKISNSKYGPDNPRPTMSVEARKKLSIAQSTKNRGGKSKWYEVAGQKVQGTWERDLAIKFESLNIKWDKLKIHKDVWSYNIDGKTKSYTPDFYLPEFDVYLDPKGYWWGDDRRKIEEIKKQHHDKKLIIIERELFRNILKNDYEYFVNIIRNCG